MTRIQSNDCHLVPCPATSIDTSTANTHQKQLCLRLTAGKIVEKRQIYKLALKNIEPNNRTTTASSKAGKANTLPAPKQVACKMHSSKHTIGSLL